MPRSNRPGALATGVLAALCALACNTGPSNGGDGGILGGQTAILGVAIGGTGSGTVSGSGISCAPTCTATLAVGTNVVLTATPASGSSFGLWTGCDSVSGTSCSLTVNANRTVTAVFNAGVNQSYDLAVVKNGSGSGTVTGNGINCGSTCDLFLPAGTQVTLTATPASGSVFAGWSSACTTVSGNSCSLTLGASVTVQATFNSSSPGNDVLSVSKAGSGSGTVTGNGINCGSTCTSTLPSGTAVTLTAAAAVGSTFAGWSGCDSVNGTTCTLSLTSNRTVTATFNPALTNYTLTAAKAGSGSGTVSGNGINCGGTCSAVLPSGTQVTLTATPAVGSTFVSWSGCDSVSGSSCSLVLSANRTVTATFNVTSSSYTLSVTKSGSGSGTVSGNGISCGSTCTVSLASGTSVSLTATPASGSVFSGWTGCDSASGATCTLVLTANRTVNAAFNPSGPHTVNLTPTSNNGGLFSTVDSTLANTVYPNQSDLPIGCVWQYYSTPSPGYQDAVCGLALLLFDVSSLSGHTIVSAQLQLTVLAPDSGSVRRVWDLYAPADPWSPSSVTWNVAITLRYWVASFQQLTPPTGTGVASIDVTTTVSQWVSGGWPNRGFLMQLDSYAIPNATSNDVFDLGGTGQYVPVLVVQYQ